MTEKRFENRLDKSNVKFNTLNPVWDNEKEDALNVFEMIDELNRLNLDCSNLIDDNTEYVAEINQMHKENEQLKSEIEKLSYANEDLLSEKRNWQRMSDEYCKLSDENEHIKNTIQEAYHNERTHIGKSVLKQLLNNIGEI